MRGRALVRAARDGHMPRLQFVALDDPVAHGRQRLQRLGRAAQHAGPLRIARAAEHGAAGVHHNCVHAVARLYDAPAHFLDDAWLHAPRTISACPSYPSSRRSSKRSIPS